MSKNIKKIEEALVLIEDARTLIDSVMHGDLKYFQITSNYYAYNEYGLKQIVGSGNPYDGKLQDIIDTLEEEGL